MPQRPVRYYWPQVGAADADIDDVAYGLAGVAPPFTAADAVGEISHLVKHGMNLRHHVVAVHDNRCSFWGAQRHMQHSSLFCGVDLLAMEHPIAPLRDASPPGELNEQSNCFIGNPLFRASQSQACAFDANPLSS